MNAVQLTLAKLAGNTNTETRLFDFGKMVDIKASGTGISFFYPTGKNQELVEHLTGALTLSALENSINAANAGGNQVMIGRIDTTSGFAIGAHNVLDANGNALVIKDNSRVWGGFYEVITTFTSATDAATISFDIATDDVAGLKAATAISTGTTYDATGAPVLIIPQQSVATISEKTTAARNITYTVAVEALTAGSMILFLEIVNEGL